MIPTGSIVSVQQHIMAMFTRDKLCHIIQFYYNNVTKIINRSVGDQEMRYCARIPTLDSGRVEIFVLSYNIVIIIVYLLHLCRSLLYTYTRYNI